MRFYDVDAGVLEALEKGDKAVRVKICVDWDGDGAFEDVAAGDLIEARFWGLREAAGGVSARGEVVIDNARGRYAEGGFGAGREARVYFTVGDGLPWFERFVLFIDDRGIRDAKGPGRKRVIRLGLWDRSYLLRRTDESRDWTAQAVFAYSVVCDKSRPGESLVHGIAQRAGLGVTDIDCCMISLTVPYIHLRRNIWAELSALATAYRCHLECAKEKPLVFAHSPYQCDGEPGTGDGEQGYMIRGEDIYFLRTVQRADVYRNTVRLKINMPVVLERQEIWRYRDEPVIYDDALQAAFPFRAANLRDIEKAGYEGLYEVKDDKGAWQRVVYADQIDTLEEASGRLDYDGGPFVYSGYDVTSAHDRAALRLDAAGDGELYAARIFGRPIVLDLNRSCFLHDDGEIALRGTKAVNVTGIYFSPDLVDGKPQYEDWAERELEARLNPGRELAVKTHRGLFHARVGAAVEVATNEGTARGVVKALSLWYRRGRAFETALTITED